jgi:hypothetical protein
MGTTEASTKPVEHTTKAVDEQLWALMCADEELLNAEFEAIIAAEWHSPPTHTVGRGAEQRRPDAPVHGRTHPLRPPAGPAHPDIDGWFRQRSPPHEGE